MIVFTHAISLQTIGAYNGYMANRLHQPFERFKYLDITYC